MYKTSKANALVLAAKKDGLQTVLAKYLANSMTPEEVHTRVVSLTLNAIALEMEECLLSPDHESPWKIVLDELESRCAEKNINISLSHPLISS